MADTYSSLSDLHHIADLYRQIDSYLESSRYLEDPLDDGASEIFRKQLINDQAYFVLAWGQLEAMIEKACRNVIRHGRSQSDWKNRRIWMLYNPEDRRLSGLSFENRLTLVLEKGSENWKQTVQFYHIRNQIAHGNLGTDRMDVTEAIQDFFKIQSSLACE